MAYLIGTGIGEVTDPAAGLPQQGMADQRQVTTGVESPLFARAFVVADAGSGARVAVVIADIWSATRRLKHDVLERLAATRGDAYTDDNLLLAGTHTHSAPGGYSGNLLYDFDFSRGGCDAATVRCIVDGVVQAVGQAHERLAPGRILVNRGDVGDCGGNRSRPAYACNPQAERDFYGADTDREMLLLKFVHTGDGGERPVGTLNWFAVHPTDRGQETRAVNGDNKGHAAALFEEAMGGRGQFVAAFANANCGDVSPNVGLEDPPPRDAEDDRKRMEQHGQAQFDVAHALFVAAADEVEGPVAHRHTRADFSHIEVDGGRTWPAALGLSFGAGSTVDSKPDPDIGIREGLTRRLWPCNWVRWVLAHGFLSAVFRVNPVAQAFAGAARQGHWPKPIVLMPGLKAKPFVPEVLPVQLLRIGTVAVVGVPGELSTMAGRRLRKTVLGVLQTGGVCDVALGTYANEYAQYFTTAEEYGAQHYEGASTLFGPHQLAALQQVAARLATAMRDGEQIEEGPPPMPWTSSRQRRFRVRSHSHDDIALRFYSARDQLRWIALPHGRRTAKAHRETAFFQRRFSVFGVAKADRLTVRVGGDQLVSMDAGDLLVIAEDGTASAGPYEPPPRSAA